MQNLPQNHRLIRDIICEGGSEMARPPIRGTRLYSEGALSADSLMVKVKTRNNYTVIATQFFVAIVPEFEEIIVSWEK